jgi:type I restriction enzyme, S subunit
MTLADVWQLRDGTLNVVCDTAEKISKLGLMYSSAVKHSAGTVILSRTASVGFSAILGTDMATSQDFVTWTCGQELHPSYLLYALRAMAPDMRRLVAGSTHKTVYMPDIEQLRTPLPSIIEQRRIARYLDTETARIKQMSALQHAAQDIAEHRDVALVDQEIDDLAARYELVPFGRYITRVEQGVSPQCDNVPAAEDEWGVLKVSAVREGILQPGENKRLPDDVAPIRRYEIRHSDLLVTRANTPALVGAAAIVRQPRPQLLLCDKIFRLDVSPDLDKDFLVCIARGSRVRELCAAASHGASQSMANLKVSDIKTWLVPAAPLSDQRRLVELVRESQSQVHQLRTAIDVQLALLSERKQALITAAVTGQMDVATARGHSS